MQTAIVRPMTLAKIKNGLLEGGEEPGGAEEELCRGESEQIRLGERREGKVSSRKS